jgi:signal transduction histidine kinase
MELRLSSKLSRMDGRLEVIEDEILDIKRNLEKVIYRHEFEFLKDRVEQVEKIVQAMAKKPH